MRRVFAVVLCLAAALALADGVLADETQAEAPLSGADFGRIVTGRTLDWGDQGLVFGREQYLPDGRVKWQVPGGDCKLGRWYEAAPGLICFRYEDGDSPVCWHFFRRGAGLAAQAEGDDSGRMWSEIGSTPEPLACAGPMIGV